MNSERVIWVQGVAPRGGVPQARKNWSLTMQKPVEFSDSNMDLWEIPESLRRQIKNTHPSGEAPVWGYHKGYTAKMKAGDIVFFVGDNHFHHIGIVGCVFESTGFSRKNWISHGEGYSYVYTFSALMDLQNSAPSSVVLPAVGYSAEWNPQALGRPKNPRLLEDYFAAEIDALTLRAELLEGNADRDGRRSGISIRRNRESSTIYTIAEQTTEAIYKEDILMKAYEAYLETSGQTLDRGIGSNRSGQVDGLRHDTASSTTALVEAKSSCSRFAIRTAIGQLLDYRWGSPEDIDSLEILLPDRPSQDLLDLCMAIGIDVVYQTSASSFHHYEAVEVARQQILSLALNPSTMKQQR